MRIVVALLWSLVVLGWSSTAQAAIPASELAVLTSLYTSTNGASWTNSTNWNGAAGTECTWFGVTCDGTDSNVTDINLPANNLVGTLPPLDALTALRSLSLSSNQLSGSIPPLSGLTALQSIFVDSNQLTGPIPSLSGMTALQVFYVNDNQLSGAIPSLSGLTAMQIFSVTNNQLSGAIPSLSGLTALQIFSVINNQLSGAIPSLSGLTALQIFSVISNQLTGAIPSLSDLTGLQYFYAANNQLTGPIPPLSGLTALLSFYVNNNQLAGPVPAAPTQLTPGQSNLCDNSLVTSGNASIDAAWVTATGGDWIACQAAVVVRPTCTLTASPASIVAGGSSTLSANCPGATSYVWSANSGFGSTVATGTVSPTVTTTYTVAGTNSAGTSAVARATITVTVAVATPVCTLTATPASIKPGSTSNLTAHCSPTPASYVWTGGTCAGRSAPSCVVAPTASTTYTVAGKNVTGTGTAASATVTVEAATASPGGVMTSFGTRGTVTPTAPMYGSFALSNSSLMYLSVRGPSLKTLGFTQNPLDLPNLRIFDAAGKDVIGTAATGCPSTGTSSSVPVSNYYAGTGGPLDVRDTCLSGTLPAGVYTFTIGPNTPSSSGELLFEVRVNPEAATPGGVLTSFGTRGTVTTAAPMYGAFALTNSSVMYVALRGPSLGTLGFTQTPLDLPNLRVFDASGKDVIGAIATGCPSTGTSSSVPVATYYAGTGGPLDVRDTCLSGPLPAGVYTFTVNPNTSSSSGELLFEVRVNP